jgi:hypothetical protein
LGVISAGYAHIRGPKPNQNVGEFAIVRLLPQIFSKPNFPGSVFKKTFQVNKLDVLEGESTAVYEWRLIFTIIGKIGIDDIWPNRERDFPAIHVKGSSAMHRIAEVWARNARRAATDPEGNIGLAI